MAATGKILSESADGVGWLTFNNPERHNAVSLAMWEDVGRALAAFMADPAVRVVVIRGAGGKAFVSGADISKFDEERAAVDAVARYDAATEAAYDMVKSSPKPTIAMIEGYCIGGGMNLAVCCDLRICNARARFAVPAAKLGLGYGYTRVRRLLDVVSPAFAKEIFFTARQFSADEAAVMGLVNRVLPDEELERFVTDTARQIAGNAPLTIAALKAVFREAAKDPADRDIDATERLVAACFASQDYVEGRQAFKDKRPPVFTGR